MGEELLTRKHEQTPQEQLLELREGFARVDKEIIRQIGRLGELGDFTGRTQSWTEKSAELAKGAGADQKTVKRVFELLTGFNEDAKRQIVFEMARRETLSRKMGEVKRALGIAIENLEQEKKREEERATEAGIFHADSETVG